jgi:uncharacterized protein YjbI with pentapeptide repeats
MLAWRGKRIGRQRRNLHAPPLWSVWAAAPVILIVGAMVAVLLYMRIRSVAVPVEVPKGEPRIDALEVIRTTLTILGYVGALLAGLYAYRKQRLSEGDAGRADAQLLADRYSKSAEQLGMDQAAVRLAGVYSLARLADDWFEQQQTCVDVLCAYLRMPYKADDRPGEDEVRKTIVRVIAAHLDDLSASTSWSSLNFDFTGAHLENPDFRKATFSGRVSFERASFTGAAEFIGATFLGSARFVRATFLGPARFTEAVFRGVASFEAVKFGGIAAFPDTRFFGASTFKSAEFEAVASFGLAQIMGIKHGAAFFERADFGGAKFSGFVDFGGAVFRKHVSFAKAEFFGDATFEGTELIKSAFSFHESKFAGDVVWGTSKPLTKPNDQEAAN